MTEAPNLDDLLFDQVKRILDKDTITAAEVEVCRKYLNDRAGRMGKTFTQGFTSPDAAKQSNWKGITFDDVNITDERTGPPDVHSGAAE